MEEQVATKTPLKPKKGKLLSEPKPANSARALLDSPTKTSRPVSVYKERVTDSETGKTDWYYFWHTEDSKTVGRDDIVQVNEKTQYEKLIGHDYNIKANAETKKQLLGEAGSITKFYIIDGVVTLTIDNPEKDF